VCCTPWKIGNKRAMSKLWRRTTYSTQLTNRGRTVNFVNCLYTQKGYVFNTLNLVYPFNVSTELQDIPKKTQGSKFIFLTALYDASSHLVFFVLSGIRKTWDDSGDSWSRRNFTCIDHDE
jgi:hypothetical protein